MQRFQSFHRNPKTPDPLPPAGSCDSQFHVFAPTDQYPVRAGAAYHMAEATIEQAKGLHRRLGIARGVVVQSTAYGTNNRLLADALAQAGPNYRGIAVIDETVSDGELETLRSAGVVGIRFNFMKKLNLVPSQHALEHSIARAREIGWLVKFHATPSDVVELEPLFRQLEMPVVLDHMGGSPSGAPEFAAAAEAILRSLVVERPNLWVMLSNGDRRSTQGRPYDDSVALARDLSALAPDRVLWGSDWPHPMVPIEQPAKDDGELLELAYRYCTSPEQVERMLVSNPARLFGFPGSDNHKSVSA